MRILMATGNAAKLAEVAAILAPLGIEAVGLDALPEPVEAPEETEPTFAGNARIKALAYATAARGRFAACLAEDSGLEVDALHGAPGVRSARWSGEGGPRDERDRLNNALLLEQMRDVPPGRRAARFVCAMCLADAEGRVLHETRGVFEGEIAQAPRGANGFGYDPLLWLPDLGCTSAELAPEEKNARSHRGAAARAMGAWLAANLATTGAGARPGPAEGGGAAP